MKAFFSNRAVNLINVHTALKHFAIHMADVFGAIYLYQLGFELYQIFLVWVVIFVLRFIIRPFGLWLANRRGLRKSVFFGSLFYIGYYLVLIQVGGIDAWLFIFAIYTAFTDIFYWLPYHAYFSALGDHENRGRQVGVREALVGISAISAPIIGGLLINTFGFATAFITAACFSLISAIPIYLAPEVKIGKQISFKKAWRERFGFWIFVGDGWHYNTHFFTWNLILFILLGSVVEFGLLLGLAAIFQTLGFLLLGRAIDRGSGWKIYRVGVILVALTAIGRAIFVDTVPEVIFFDILLAIAVCFYRPSFNTALYNSGKKSLNVIWFHFLAETGWDVGSVIALSFAAALTFFDGNPRIILLFGLGGLIIVNSVLRRYYRT